MLNTDCVSKMSVIIYVLCLCLIIPIGESIAPQPILDKILKQDSSPPSELLPKEHASPPILVGDKPKIEFPKKTDVSTPILIGDDPKKGNLPPKIFPVKQDKELSGSIIASTDKSSAEIKHDTVEGKVNLTDGKVSEKSNTTLQENVTKKESPQESNDRTVVGPSTAEQEDMLHSKYKGGQDVDELKPEKKASEKDEKKPKEDPKSEVSVSPTLDTKGPKLMNETKTKNGESMLESTSKMMAVSSSVLANTQPQQHGIIEPVKTVVSVLLTAVALLCFGAIGLLVWKRIAMRRFGRDVLINEDDFDEVADMHTFDRAQIQIT